MTHRHRQATNPVGAARSVTARKRRTARRADATPMRAAPIIDPMIGLGSAATVGDSQRPLRLGNTLDSTFDLAPASNGCADLASSSGVKRLGEPLAPRW